MSTATRETPSFKVPTAGAASPTPTRPEPAKTTGPKLERPFQRGDLHGFSDDDLRGVLLFTDIINPDEMCYPRRFADITGMSDQQAFELFNGRDKNGQSNIEDTRDFLGCHPCAFGYRILEFLEGRPDIRPNFNEYALAGYRRAHPELFKKPPGGENLIERMRMDKAKIEAEKAAAERQKAAKILNQKWERMAPIMSRYSVPTDQDVAEAIELAPELGLDEAELDRRWRWLKSVCRRQQRVDALQAKGARFDPKNEDIKRLRKSAAAMPAFFEVSSEYPYPRLKFPPVLTD